MLTKLFLALGGVTALALGSAILLAPVPFYAGYGIDLTGQVTLLNEMRSHGLSLIGLGALISSGALRERMVGPALLASAFLYLSYGLSRLVAIFIDGLPAESLLTVAVVELAIGALSALFAYRRRSRGEVAAA